MSRVAFSPWDGTASDVLLDGARVGAIRLERGDYSVEIPQVERRTFGRHGDAKKYARKSLRGKVAARAPGGRRR